MVAANQVETRVKLSGVHLCCEGCTGAVEDAVSRVPGVSVECSIDDGTATLSAQDPEAIQQALDAIAGAGFHGESDNKSLTMRPDPNLPEGRIKKATISQIHNCCDICYGDIQKAIHSTQGVAADTGGPKKSQFEVTGDFSADELLQNLHKAGFNARVMV